MHVKHSYKFIKEFFVYCTVLTHSEHFTLLNSFSANFLYNYVQQLLLSDFNEIFKLWKQHVVFFKSSMKFCVVCV